MTIFSDNPHDRRMERLMMTVPNFAPRGVGFCFTEAQLFITTTAVTPTEILTATMRQIRCPPFRKRFNEYIESEEKPMTYINEKHRARFELAAKNILKANYALLSALYLLTADQRLWSCCKHHIINGCVFFENIKLNNCTERAYTLYCAAKDLTLGTKHLTVSDLSDADLVPPMLFRTICNAMALRSSFAKDIFAQDLLCEYKKQTEHRDALKVQSREVLAELIAKINGGTYDNPQVEDLLQALAKRLAVTNGKKQYGYLRKDIKEIINSIVDELGKDERIAALYDLWYESKETALKVYTESRPERLPLSQNKEFKSVKNMVIAEAMKLNLPTDEVEETDEPTEPDLEPTVEEMA